MMQGFGIRALDLRFCLKAFGVRASGLVQKLCMIALAFRVAGPTGTATLIG